MPGTGRVLNHDERQAVRHLVSEKRRELTPHREERSGIGPQPSRRAKEIQAELRATGQQERREQREADLVARGLIPETESEASLRRTAAVIADAADKFSLTLREVEILSYIAEGYRDTEVARRLYIATTTVKKHLASICVKLGAANRTNAVYLVLRSQNASATERGIAAA